MTAQSDLDNPLQGESGAGSRAEMPQVIEDPEGQLDEPCERSIGYLGLPRRERHREVASGEARVICLSPRVWLEDVMVWHRSPIPKLE